MIVKHWCKVVAAHKGHSDWGGLHQKGKKKIIIREKHSLMLLTWLMLTVSRKNTSEIQGTSPEVFLFVCVGVNLSLSPAGNFEKKKTLNTLQNPQHFG